MPSDPLPHLPLPDPLLARKALNEVRSVVRAGLGYMRETIDQAPLPTPVAVVAVTVLGGVDRLAHQADAAASTMVHGLMAATGVELDDPEGRAAGGLAAALRRAATALGGSDLMVREMGVREALRRTRREATVGDGNARAAVLMGHLLRAEAVRTIASSAHSKTVPVAVFAAVLADLQARAADPAVVAASAAIAEALAEEIQGAGSDGELLSRLFAEFRNHV